MPDKSVVILACGALEEALSGAFEGAGYVGGALEDPPGCLIYAKQRAHLAPLGEVTTLDLADMLDLSREAYDLCLPCAERMQAAGGGAIILRTGDYAVGGMPRSSAYAAAIGAFFDLCRVINGRYPLVRANLIATSAESEPLRTAVRSASGPRADAILERTRLLGKPYQDQDFVNAALFLAGERGLRGQVLMLNGGIRAVAHAQYVKL